MLRASVVVFPGSNCDRDVQVALEKITGFPVKMVWHGDASVPASDLIVLPGGFSYGDYLRCGAMAAHSPIMRDVIAKAKAGTPVLGICNGFQVLCESGLLPGVLMRNASLKFICRDVTLRVDNAETFVTKCYRKGEVVRLPIAHAEGNYFAATWKKVVFAISVAGVLSVPAFAIAGTAGLAYVAGLVGFYAAYEILHRREHTCAGIGAYSWWRALKRPRAPVSERRSTA